jgi:hypothetical protein
MDVGQNFPNCDVQAGGWLCIQIRDPALSRLATLQLRLREAIQPGPDHCPLEGFRSLNIFGTRACRVLTPTARRSADQLFKEAL